MKNQNVTTAGDKKSSEVTHKVKFTTGRTPEGAPITEVKDMTVVREGTKLIVPKGASWADLRKALKQMEEEEESIMTTHTTIDCFPLDGMVALEKAMADIYGFSSQSTAGFFGPNPPHRVAIKTGPNDDDITYALHGNFAPPAWEGGVIGVRVDMNHPLSITITGQFKKKFAPEINEIIATTRQNLRTNSIYRGKAVELNFSYIDSGEDFSPDHDAPKFMDVSKQVDLILPSHVEFEMESSVWSAIMAPEELRHNGIDLKYGVLLKGVFGTGKSLTSYVTAQKCVEGNWSFFFLKDPAHFLHAYKMSQLYGPSVLFVEDIDMLFGGDRTPLMNQILETMDGVAAKKSEVIVVFTTNNADRIHAAFLRPGRIDAVIELTPPDAEAAERFVTKIGGEFLSDEAKANMKTIGEAFAGLVPANINDGIKRAKKVAIARARAESGSGMDIRGKVTTEMLVSAANTMHRQVQEITGGTVSKEAAELAIIKGAAEIVSGDGADTKEVLKEVAQVTSGLTRS